VGSRLMVWSAHRVVKTEAHVFAERTAVRRLAKMNLCCDACHQARKTRMDLEPSAGLPKTVTEGMLNCWLVACCARIWLAEAVICLHVKVAAGEKPFTIMLVNLHVGFPCSPVAFRLNRCCCIGSVRE